MTGDDVTTAAGSASIWVFQSRLPLRASIPKRYAPSVLLLRCSPDPVTIVPFQYAGLSREMSPAIPV